MFRLWPFCCRCFCVKFSYWRINHQNSSFWKVCRVVQEGRGRDKKCGIVGRAFKLLKLKFLQLPLHPSWLHLPSSIKFLYIYSIYSYIYKVLVQYKVLGNNADGILKKLESLEYKIKKEKPGVVFLQETKVKRSFLIGMKFSKMTHQLKSKLKLLKRHWKGRK